MTIWIVLIASWLLTVALFASHISLIRYIRRLRSKLASPGDEWSLRIILILSALDDHKVYLKKILEKIEKLSPPDKQS